MGFLAEAATWVLQLLSHVSNRTFLIWLALVVALALGLTIAWVI